MNFRPGLELAGAFYREVVAPLLGDAPHAAALAGWGSDVLGYDTPRSVDHGWGPRLQIFVEPADLGVLSGAVEAGLPEFFRGWPTRFGWDDVPPTRHVEVTPLPEWLRGRLGFDPEQGISLRDWLGTPQQALLEVTSGRVFHDGPGRLTAVRDSLTWYPDQVWLWLLACQWRRISQEEAFAGRAAEVGDDLGSRVVTARLVRDLMRLAFLIERRYAPYSKWLGTGFTRLEAGATAGPLLSAALAAGDWAGREAALNAAAADLAVRHNALGLTRPVDTATRPYYSRPYLVLSAGRFADACLERLTEPRLRAAPLTGAIDQWVDSTDVLSSPARFRRAGEFYAGPEGGAAAPR